MTMAYLIYVSVLSKDSDMLGRNNAQLLQSIREL